MAEMKAEWVHKTNGQKVTKLCCDTREASFGGVAKV